MSLEKLLEIAGPSLIAAPPALREPRFLDAHGAVGEQLAELLYRRNGFYAFESALHVFPAGTADRIIDIETWNSPSLWRFEYGAMADGCVFFAEDVFGCPFCLRGGRVCRFEPESGAVTEYATSLDEWARSLLADWKVETGWSLAHEWQAQHGPIRAGQRLLPCVPFVCGGDFALDNLSAGDAVEGMRFRGYVARQIKDLPDGTRVQFKFVPERQDDAAN